MVNFIKKLLSFALSIPLLFLVSCDTSEPVAKESSSSPSSSDLAKESPEEPNALVWIESTSLRYKALQPWDSRPPQKKYAYGTIIEGNQILTTASLVEFATYIEVQSADEQKKAKATVARVDEEMNLALLEIDDPSFFDSYEAIPISDTNATKETAINFLGFNTADELVTASGSFDKYRPIGQMKSLGQRFKTELEDVSWQSGMPALSRGKLAGIAIHHYSKSSEVQVIPASIIRFFLSDDYTRFPILGIQTSSLRDKHLRAWLQLPEELNENGRYLSKTALGGAADQAGLKPGDVLTHIQGLAINLKGEIKHPTYGLVNWFTPLRDGLTDLNKTVKITIYREGKAREIDLPLNRDALKGKIIPSSVFNQHPKYLIYGGVIFRELTPDYYKIFGNDWQKTAPIKLLSYLHQPEKVDPKVKGLTVLSFSLQTPATISYENLTHAVVKKVNNIQVISFTHFAELIDKFSKKDDLITIEIDHMIGKIVLDPSTCQQVNHLLQQRGFGNLKRL